jgi:hypothetical protein
VRERDICVHLSSCRLDHFSSSPFLVLNTFVIKARDTKLWWSLWGLSDPIDWGEKLTRSRWPFERGKGLKETGSLWPPQRRVGLQEPNLGKTNHCVTLFICLWFVFALSFGLAFISNANPACRLFLKFINFRCAYSPPPPLGDFQLLFCVDNEQYEVSKCVAGDYLEQQPGEGNRPLTHYVLLSL